ncbi:MAG TPA: hypothetical protein VNO21_09090 [Polyangiaceae bacterium]|nr:hypothetical protein [Polyangiaceae bacterium]
MPRIRHFSFLLAATVASACTAGCQGGAAKPPTADSAAVHTEHAASTVTADAASASSGDPLDAGAAAPRAEEAPNPDIESVRLFILAVDQALRAKSAKALAKLVHFPMRASYLDYAMELRQKSMTLANAAAALRHTDVWEMPGGFVAVAKKGVPRRALEPCQQDAGPVDDDGRLILDWTLGPPAIEIHGNTAIVSAEAGPCQVDTHKQIWHLQRTNDTWTLMKADADNRPAGGNP